MRPAENIENFIKRVRLKASAQMHKRTLNDALEAQEKSRKTKSAKLEPNICRIIMKSPITKLVAAAVIVVAVLIGISTFNGTTAWAIEQTIEAIEGFQAIYSSGITVDEDGTEFEVEFWARPNSEGTSSGDLRMETKGGKVIVVNEAKNVTHKYDTAHNVVLVESGNRFYCRPWINGEYFQKMKESCTDWQEEYRKDELTGRDCVFVTARNPKNNQSYKFQFDLGTKLPVRGKVWHNSDFKGKPYVTANEIIYNLALAEGIFDFEIPEGAKVIKED